ncbi:MULTISPECIES: protoporphyrinogen oxidase HemJ [unclassified Campylobacter]|uniref:protoporphyrinogen oxidase HemJ n=1 Tax=unclassified Campylobacter TaxID=2593542 RepID=UPI001237A90E|nr:MULTISPECIES: protoporphyrinogen oxidase HemJ [unclassified Campylobacter]KAA6227123.1 protoporphyrinogen oxidase HemJ [Campylobacter sp. LR185c]KAA6227480.1 protoporphyrinogen oxidase HemJ [Campylobacter sp. LR196d]KAA6228506.1 protoporphyrinogen oxidase HemJ [Campylobacter sp. LR286c]KAA6230897.1 protoporphyrinogen oxidase HemJ [Campylobacter sp. LR291e]KAA6233531.1 protoporphyrinogen oxidase HemJ [Campylobacter sp. LR264d]
MLYEYYIWIKVIHYLAFVSWMAGLFYLPRLFVYHVEHIENKGFVEVVKIQEYKLFYYIQSPAMIVALITGILMLIANPALLKGAGFMHVKILCVVLLLLYHFHNFLSLKSLANDSCKKSGKFFRAYNEIPTLIFIVIAIVMIARPF